MKLSIAVFSSLLLSSAAFAGVPGSIIFDQEPSFECSAVIDDFAVKIEGQVFPVLMDGGSVLSGVVIDGDLATEGEPVVTAGLPGGVIAPTGVPPMLPDDFVGSVNGNMTVTFSSINGFSPDRVQYFTLKGTHHAGYPVFSNGEGYRLSATNSLPVLADMQVNLTDADKTVLVEKDGQATHDVIRVKEAVIQSGGKFSRLKCDVINFN